MATTHRSDPARPAGLHVDPLPPYASARDVLSEAVAALRPMARVAVSDTAERRMIEAGGQWVPYRWDVAPYMREPGDVTTSRRFDSVVFVGPARSSKSEGLIVNPIVHAILAQPRKVAMFSPTKNAAQEWSDGYLSSLIAASPELSERLIRSKGGNNVFAKRFRGGMRLTIDYPVEDALSQRSLDLVLSTDHDKTEMDADGGKLGGVFGRMRKRTEAAGTRGMTIVESSPRFPILDETWAPTTPHEAPPCGGIVGLYNQGSRGRLYWTCPHCGARFVPDWGRIQWPDAGSIGARAEAAYMVCPANGCVIEAGEKRRLNAGAVWLHEDIGGEIVPLADLSRKVATASYWLPAPAAALAPWSRLVSRMLEAEEAYRSRNDEQQLRADTNVELGLPYLPRSLTAENAVSADRLRDAATTDAWGVCPEGTAFVTVCVDVQGARFAVQVEAWSAAMTRTVIDRFDIVAPPETAPRAEGRAINPGRYPEDAEALAPLIERVWPVAGRGYGLMPVAVTCDYNGPPGWSANAQALFRALRRRHPGRFRLVQGRGGDGHARAVVRRPETAHAGKKFAARDVPRIFAATDRLKDEVAAALVRPPGVSARLAISRGAPAEIYDEYAAERRYEKGWDKRPGYVRNEALDLSVYALATSIVLEAEAINWAAPPAWAVAGPGNQFAVQIAADPAAESEIEPVPVAAPAARIVVKGGSGRRRGRR